jgi:flagella basal body P-ring formation protein FlgA
MPRFKPFCGTALTLGLIVVCNAAAAHATEICFRPTASVSTATVMLKDVATVSGGDAASIARLEQTVLGPAPAPGRTSRLDFDEIRSRLEATGASTADANFSGAAVVVVSCTQQAAPAARKSKRKTHVNVSPAQVRRAEKIMTQSVRQSLRGKGREAGNLFLEVVVEPSDVPIILAGATEGFQLGPIDVHNANTQNVDVRTQDSQGQAVRFQIQCVASEKPRLPVLTRSVTAGEVIHEDDLGWKQAESTEGLLMHVEDVVGKEAKKGLHADEPLHADDVRSVPLVRSNDIVTGVWQRGSIRITGQFKSKSDGGKGDIISLIQLTGRDQVLARVIDVHEAEIVTADAVRPRQNADEEDQAATAPVQTVAHQTTARKKRRKAPAVINAAATNENDTNTTRGEPSDPSSR